MQNWNDLIRTQLDNLASFPAKQVWKLGEWIGECAVRPEVANFAALPLVGNTIGEVRASVADQAWYIWDGAAWQSMGGGGGGAVNSVTASAPLASSGGANPNISLTGVVAAANGGTGLSAPGAVGNVLTSNGVGWATAPLPATVTPGAPLTSVQFNNGGAFGGSASLTWNGSTLAVDGAVDRATAGTLTVGGTTATAITVGKVGVTTTFPGPVNLTGDVTTVGGTQFTTDAQFDGNVTFGNASTDNISFVGQVDTAITQEGIAAPAVSPAGTGRIYFDSGTNTFKASQNGGAYVDIINSAAPGGAVGDVQLNDGAGNFAGSTDLTFASNTLTVTNTVDVTNGANTLTLQAASVGSDAATLTVDAGTTVQVGGVALVNISGAFTLPGVDGANGQVLTTDGAGNVSWASAGGGGTITGSGTATQIAYFTGATAIGSETAVGSNSFTWDATNNRLGVGTAAPSFAIDASTGADTAIVSTTTNVNNYGQLAAVSPSSAWIMRANGSGVGSTFLGTADASWVTMQNLGGNGFKIGAVDAGDQIQLGSYEASTSTTAVRVAITDSNIVFNGPQKDYDFRVATAAGANSLFVEGSSGRVGVGTAAPSHVVDVQAGSVASGVYALNVDATMMSGGGNIVSYIEGSVDSGFPSGTPVYGVVGYLSGAGIPATSYAGNFSTTLAGNGADPVSAVQGNFGLLGASAGSTVLGHNVGVIGLANSSSARNYAVFGNTTGDTAGANVAVTGMAKNNGGGVRIGGLFASQTTGASQPTVNTSAALIADNMDLSDPIFLARDAGTTTFSIGNNGVVLAKNTTDSTAAFAVQNAAGTNLLAVNTTDQRVGVGGVAGASLTHTFNVGAAGAANFCVASGGRIHTYDGSAPTNGQVLIGDTASGNFAKATLTAGTGIAITNGAGSVTIAATGAAASTSVDIPSTAQEALNAGDLVRFVNDAGTPKVQKADATNSDARLNPVGFAVAAASSGAAVTVRVSGVADVPAARFDAAPAAANVGSRVFVSTTSGQITLTAPSTSGDVLQRAGVLVDGGANPKVLVQIGDPTLL